MKVRRKIGNNIEVEAEGTTMIELFEVLSQLEEIFTPQACGLCHKTHISFRTRDVNGVKHYEAMCRACGASFTFGQRKGAGGQLFPQRRDPATGEAKPNHGWVRWQPPAPPVPATPTNGTTTSPRK